jgi:hypothetical protein
MIGEYEITNSSNPANDATEIQIWDDTLLCALIPDGDFWAVDFLDPLIADYDPDMVNTEFDSVSEAINRIEGVFESV